MATIETFRAFLNGRPDGEKWELIDGEIVESHSATLRHQLLIGNVLFELHTARRGAKAPWISFMGIGTRVPADLRNEIVPDAMIMPYFSGVFDWTYDLLAAFEVSSPETFDRDIFQKREFYTRIPSLAHYVVLAQHCVEATVFARSEGFRERKLMAADARLELPTLGVSLALADIYRDVPLD